MSNITLHPLWHTFMPVYEHVTGSGTLCLSVLALFLMITRTPNHARPFVRYLMLLQVSWECQN